jgi:hypothetical protein
MMTVFMRCLLLIAAAMPALAQQHWVATSSITIINI